MYLILTFQRIFIHSNYLFFIRYLICRHFLLFIVTLKQICFWERQMRHGQKILKQLKNLAIDWMATSIMFIRWKHVIIIAFRKATSSKIGQIEEHEKRRQKIKRFSKSHSYPSTSNFSNKFYSRWYVLSSIKTLLHNINLT